MSDWRIVGLPHVTFASEPFADDPSVQVLRVAFPDGAEAEVFHRLISQLQQTFASFVQSNKAAAPTLQEVRTPKAGPAGGIVGPPSIRMGQPIASGRPAPRGLPAASRPGRLPAPVPQTPRGPIPPRPIGPSQATLNPNTAPLRNMPGRAGASSRISGSAGRLIGEQAAIKARREQELRARIDERHRRAALAQGQSPERAAPPPPFPRVQRTPAPLHPAAAAVAMARRAASAPTASREAQTAPAESGGAETTAPATGLPDAD